MPERAGLEQYCLELLARMASAVESLDDAAEGRAMAGIVRDGLMQMSAGMDPAPPDPRVAVHTAVTGAGQAGTGQTAGQDKASLGVGKPEMPAAPPSLEDFAAQFDDDMFSEAELAQLYEEEYPCAALTGQGGDPAKAIEEPPSPQACLAMNGDREVVDMAVHHSRPASSAAERIAQQLHAIDWLDARVGLRPEREHRVEQWVRFSEPQRQALKEVGVVTLGNLIDWMCLRGRRWVDEVPGYGQKRADSLLSWLQRSALVPAAGLPAIPSFALSTGEPSPLQPLHALRWPAALDGRDGKFRTPLANAMGATNDQEAVAAWFKRIKDKSPHTQEAYQRAIERLILWAIVERGKALSSLDEVDMVAFRDFLTHPPPHWVQEPKKKGLRQTPSWRPLRGPLNKQSLSVTFSAVSAMFSHWRRTAYTYVNSAENVKDKRAEELEMDVFRSFTKADLGVIGTTFSDLPDGPAKRRLRAILLILENGGLRRAELASAYWSELKSDRVDGERTSERVLHVKGKGNRERKVPLNAEVLEALEVHREDRMRLMQERDAKRDKPGLFSQLKPEEMPLIGVLDEKWLLAKDKETKRATFSAARPPAVASGAVIERTTDSTNSTWLHERPSRTVSLEFASSRKGALSGKMIYQLLKEFFAQCCVVAGENLKDDEAPFQKASTHWLRHTFAHKMLAIDTVEPAKLLPLVQALMGHKSINTTAIYLKADMSDRIRAVDQLKGSV